MIQIIAGTRQIRITPVAIRPETKLLTPSATTRQIASQPST